MKLSWTIYFKTQSEKLPGGAELNHVKSEHVDSRPRMEPGAFRMKGSASRRWVGTLLFKSSVEPRILSFGAHKSPVGETPVLKCLPQETRHHFMQYIIPKMPITDICLKQMIYTGSIFKM